MPPRLAALATLFAATAAIAAPVRTPHVEAELVAERTAVVPGEPLTVALRLAMIPRWHTYWRNPGDSGEPTRIDWRLPAGFAAGPIEWPVPRQIPVGPLMNYGYEGEVLLLSRLTPPADLPLGRPVTLAAKATWLVCEVQCIPEEAELSLVLPAASTSGADPRWAKSIAAARAELPAPPAALSGWHLSARGGPGGATLALAPPAGAALRALTFFPFDEGKIEPAAPQRLTRADEGYRLQLAAAAQPVGAFTRVAGILVSPQGFGPQAVRAVTVDVPIEGAVTPAVATPIATHGGIEFGLALALVAAFGGGLLLNLMPCVLPVLSIKVLGFADQGAAAHAARRRHGLLYAAGVVASFWLLAGLLLGLRSLGEELGWGFQLQSPPTVAVLALFFFVLGLNLSGVFEFGQLLPSRAAAWRARHPAFDWFLSGVLAVLVASPCTAPFMGAALGYAVGEGGGHAFAVFTALGVGMALPYAMLAWFPAWLRRLPKPGPWMERLQQLLAFPLYATAVWLAWVLGLLAGIDALIWLLAAAVLAAAAAWFIGGSGVRGPAARAAAALLAIAAIAVAIPGAQTTAHAPAASGDAVWRPYAAGQVAALVADGKPVFIDFTAAWCVTCQVNKRLVLAAADVQVAFRTRGVELVRADWTRRDAEITRALAALGRSGVPVYVLYKPGRPPLLLPEVLTRERLLAALDG